jgi:hypothetical protein
MSGRKLLDPATYELKCPWNKAGFIEWLESVIPQGGQSRSSVQEDPHYLCALSGIA